MLRKQFQVPRAIAAGDPASQLARDLMDYDRAFGLVEGTGSDSTEEPVR